MEWQFLCIFQEQVKCVPLFRSVVLLICRLLQICSVQTCTINQVKFRCLLISLLRVEFIIVLRKLSSKHFYLPSGVIPTFLPHVLCGGGGFFPLSKKGWGSPDVVAEVLALTSVSGMG